jgi:hypothetical protein
MNSSVGGITGEITSQKKSARDFRFAAILSRDDGVF